MPEITLRDLLRWDRRLELLEPADSPPGVALDRGVSWVVSVRTTPPLLPPLRGEELVVIPRRAAAEIEDTQMINRQQLLDMLADQRISAILTEPGFSEDALETLPLITMPAPFPQDAETNLNRLLTERRAELYRLGNDLSRRLSQAAMDPRGVEGILGVAAELCGHPVVLQDADGQLIARGGDDAGAEASIEELDEARDSVGPVTISAAGGLERLIVPMTSVASTNFLITTAPAGTLTEVDRLVLSQTAGTAAIVLSQGNALGARGAREQSIAELLEGRLASETAAIARARGLGIEPSRPMRIGIITTQTGDLESSRRLADQLLGGLRTAERTEMGDEIAFLVANSDQDAFAQRLSRMVERTHSSRPVITLGHQISSITQAPHALRQARFARGLVAAGVVAGPVVRSDSLDDIGVFGLLYHLWGNPAVEQFRQDCLGALEEYDRRRGTELINTLRVYLNSGGSLAESAALLNVHRNTLSYRISRISELSGRDLNQPNDRLLLRIALLCLDLTRVDEST